MSKTILISTPPWGVVMPPLGIACLSSYLKTKGKKVQVCDLNLELFENADPGQKSFWNLDTINKMAPADIAHSLYRGFKTEIDSFVLSLKDFDIAAFSANNLISTTFAGIAAEKIKAADPCKIIVVGGPGCFHSWDRKSVPEDAVDFFVVGEGEEVLAGIIDTFETGGIPALAKLKLPGLLNNLGKKKTFSPAVAINDLDALPFPDFHEFDLARYNPGSGYRPLPLLMSRGCINRCSYCIDWYMCSAFRVRKPENILREIKHHVEQYKITHVEFNDLLCNGNLVHLEKFCDLMIESKIDVRWISYAAIRRNMSDRLLVKVRKSGCNSLCYGIESGSDRILRRMNKHYTSEDAADLIKRTDAAGIEVRMNIIVGFPGETEEDFNETLEFVRRNKSFIRQVTNVSSFVLMPGSDLAVYPQRFGIRYQDETDPGSWIDELGLTQLVRNERVAKTCRLLERLGIRNLIVNYQDSGTKRKIVSANTVETQNENVSNVLTSPRERIDVPRKKKHKSFFQKTVLLLLFIFSLIMDFYLFLLKKLRGSVIFPGN